MLLVSDAYYEQALSVMLGVTLPVRMDNRLEKSVL